MAGPSFLNDAEDATGTYAAADDWEQLGPSSYTVPGHQVILFVLLSVSQDGGLRLAKRERPNRPGVKLDDTNRRERVYQVEAIFHNDITEELGGDQMWPDRANAFQELLEYSGSPGTLHLPFKRNIRCRCEKYTRKSSPDQHRGGEIFSITFVEDNEERLADTVVNATVKATLAPAVDAVAFTAASEGIWDGQIEDLVTLAAQVTALINAPGEYAERVLTAARGLLRACTGIKNALTSNLEGSNGLQDPAGSSLFDALTDLQDMAGRVAGEAASTLPKTRTLKFKTDRTIYDIATELGQSARDLIQVNSDLEDPGYIPAGTPVQVFV